MKILFFSPFSFISNHSFPEAAEIKLLIKKNHEVVRLTCDRTYLNNCVSMKSTNLKFSASLLEKNKICDLCEVNARSIEKIKGLKTYYSSKFISKDQIDLIESHLRNINYQNFDFELQFQGINLNYVSLYDFILKYKLSGLSDISEERFPEFKNELRNSLISYRIGKNFLDFFKSDKLIIYSPQYSINHAFLKGYDHKKLDVYLTEGSNNVHYKHSILRLWNWKIHKLVDPSKVEWTNYNPTKLPHEAFSMVEKHFKSLIKSKSPHVYSTPKKNKYYKLPFELNKFKKTALLTMSSADESYAAFMIGAFPPSKVKSTVFKDQIEWITQTINFFKKYPEYLLIIRIHPREAPNKREKVISSRMNKLNEIFKLDNLPNNVKINWPQENVSFYNLIDKVDVLISKSSITIIEALYFDKPVVIYDNKLTNYPDDLVYSGKTRQDYFNNLIKSLKNRHLNLKNKAILWTAFSHYLSGLHLKKSFVHGKIMTMIKKILYKLKVIRLIRLFNHFELKHTNLEESSEERLDELIKKKYSSLLDSRLTFNEKLKD